MSNYSFLIAKESQPQIFITCRDQESSLNYFNFENPKNYQNIPLNTYFELGGMFNSSTILATIDIKYDEDFGTIYNFEYPIVEVALSILFLFLIYFVKTNNRSKRVLYFFWKLLLAYVIMIWANGISVKVTPQEPHWIGLKLYRQSTENRTVGLLSEFYHQYQRDKSIIKPKISKCNTCNFKPPRMNGNSNENDLVISAYTEKEKNLQYFVRSLRASHCKASIVIFTDLEPYDDLRNCGVLFIKIPKVKVPWPMMFRWSLINDFLHIIDPTEFNRVYYSDMYDSFFQGDIFTQDFSKNSLLLNSEEESIFNTYYRKLPENLFYGLDYRQTFDKPLLCSGTFGGGFEPMKFIFSIVSHWLPVYSDDPQWDDQIYYNMLIHSPMFKEMNYNITLYGFSSLISSAYRKSQYYSSTIPVVYNNSIMPTIIHHTYAVKGLNDLLKQKCPQS